jgi:deoxyribodipyrimidine photo-lyase
MTAAAESAAGCEIGKDYPRPVVDHEEAVRQAQEKFSERQQRGSGR